MDSSKISNEQTKKKSTLNSSKIKSNLFYILLMIIPVAQFIIFYIVVNFKSFGYAFMTREIVGETSTWKFTFSNFSEWFTQPSYLDALLTTIKMSAIYYGISLVVSVPLGLLFSYYIFKKLPFAGFFRVFLFIPSIIPVAVLVLSYKLILNDVTPAITGNTSLMFDQNEFVAILVYNLFVSFGTSVVMYANKMCEIPPEILEAGKLDGVVGFKEFIHVVIPLSYATITVFLITGVATLFTNQYNIFLFDRDTPSIRSIGFYLYLLACGTNGHESEIPHVASLGLMLTAVAIPLTYLIKWLLEKFGPSED